jgi:hypothetical protein
MGRRKYIPEYLRIPQPEMTLIRKRGWETTMKASTRWDRIAKKFDMRP